MANIIIIIIILGLGSFNGGVIVTGQFSLCVQVPPSYPMFGEQNQGRTDSNPSMFCPEQEFC